MTAIDTALDLTDDHIARWLNTVKRNTENYRSAGLAAVVARVPEICQHDRPGFLGAGFIGVSPALEACVEFQRVANVLALEDMSESRMDELRRALLQVIDEGAGARHFAGVATDAPDRLGRYERPLRDMLVSAKKPDASYRAKYHTSNEASPTGRWPIVFVKISGNG